MDVARYFRQDIGREIITDRVYMLFFVLGMYGMLVLVLAGTFPTEAIALFLLAVVGLVFVKRFKDSSEMKYMYLLGLPLAMKFLFYSLVYADTTDIIVNSLVSVFAITSTLGLSVLVALGEESFRAVFYRAMLYFRGTEKNIDTERNIDAVSIIITDIAWVILHFVRRINELTTFPALSLYYVIWLLIAGAILNIIFIRVGIGYAVLGHFLINSF